LLHSAKLFLIFLFLKILVIRSFFSMSISESAFHNIFIYGKLRNIFHVDKTLKTYSKMVGGCRTMLFLEVFFLGIVFVASGNRKIFL